MPTMEPLISETPWHRLAANEDDWRSEDPQVLAYLLEQLLLIRRFEERILELFKAGLRARAGARQHRPGRRRGRRHVDV